MAPTIIKPYPTDVHSHDPGDGREVATPAVVEVSFSDITQDYERIYKIDRI